MQQLGRSQVQGMCTRSMQKVKGLVEVTQVKGTTVRYIPPVMQSARGARLLLPKVAGVAMASVPVVSLLMPFQKKDHCVESTRKDLPPVTIPLLYTTTDTLVRYEPALPWISAPIVATAPLAAALHDPEPRQYCPAQEKSQSLVMRLQKPTWQQKQLLLALICVSGMMTWKGVVAQEVSVKVMAMRSKRKIWVWLQGEPAPWQKVQVTGMLLVQGQFCMLVMPEMLWMPQLAKSTTVSCWLGWTTRLRLAGTVDSKRRKLGQVWKLVLPEVEQKLLTQLKLMPPSWLSCGIAWMQVRQRQEVGFTTSLLYSAMQSGYRFLLEELSENMRLERVMVVLELQGKRLGTVLLQTVLALMVILKQLGVWKQVTRQALLVSAFQKLACRSQQCEFWSKLEEMTTLGLKKRSMQELELVAMELMLWQMLILKVWEASMVEVDLTSSIELKVLSQKVWQKVEGATALLVTSPEYRYDGAVNAAMTAVVSMYASIQNKLAVVIFIWKVTETTVPMTMGPMPEMTKAAAEQVQEGVQVSDWKLEQAVPAIMLAFWSTILMLQRSGTEQGMEICSCTNWLMFWQNCMAPEMGALQGSPTVSVSGQLTVAMGQSISQASRGVRVLQLRLQMEMLVAAMMKGLLIWLICTMNLRPTANCSLKISTKMFGDRIWQDRMAGAAQSAIGLVEQRLD